MGQAYLKDLNSRDTFADKPKDLRSIFITNTRSRTNNNDSISMRPMVKKIEGGTSVERIKMKNLWLS